MTESRNPDRLIRAWLDLMPSEAPDRVVSAVLQTVERTPQVRGLRLLGPRRSPMNRLSLVTAIAAVLAVAVAGIYLVNQRPISGVGGPPTPSTLPAATAGAAIPAALHYRWIGTPRSIPVLGESTRTGLDFDTGTFEVTGTEYGGDSYPGEPGVLQSTARLVGPDTIQLVATGSGAGCQPGAVGTFRWSMSAGGTVLTISSAVDACMPRQAVVTGTWYRVACKDEEDGCWGDLEAGTYPSQYFGPRAGTGPWAPDLGVMTYTVPTGWSNSSDWPTTFSLSRATDYVSWPVSGSPDSAFGIFVYALPAAANASPDCGTTVNASVGRTPIDLATWISQRPSVTATAPTTIQIGGRQAAYTDASIAPSWTGTCPGLPAGTKADVFLKMHDGTDWDLGIVAPESDRFLFIDIGGGDVVLVEISSPDPAEFTSFLNEAMPIVESFTFR